MAGTHNFKTFDSANSNMTSDESYTSDTNRINGVSNGVADPFSFNKAVHQATIMSSALAQLVANSNQTFDDTNLTNLITALTNCLATLTTTSYADRITHGLFGQADIGAITYCAAQSAPASATYTASGTGNLLGGYHYREVFITGYNNPDGTRYVRGFSPAAQRSSYDVSPSSQQVSITNLPLGTAGCIGRAIYRSSANGSPGTEKYCGIIWDNTTTTYTDNLVDSQLGTGMPTVQGTAVPANVPSSNTTGTTVPLPAPAQIGAAIGNGNLGNVDLNTVTQSGMYRFNAPTNGPPGVGYSQLLVIHGALDTITQIVGDYSTGILYTRSGAPASVGGAGSWTDWTKPAASIADYASNFVATTSAGLRNMLILEHRTDSVPSGITAGTTVWWKDQA